jgi:hypothetical protein
MRIKCRLYLFDAALVSLQLTYVGAVGAMAAATSPAQSSSSAGRVSPGPNDPGSTEAPAAGVSGLALSPEAERVSEIARENGDKDFLMVDKARGEVILFKAGKPVYSGPALTGASRGDRIPPKVLTFSGNHPLSPDQKVTPAGRFTVTSEADPAYGRVWTLNEVHGKDWDFAIHQVFLGIPSEHRDARIHSSDPTEHHITFGCINVERSTVQFLTRTLPKKGKVPLYILPQDESLTAALFPLRESRSASIGTDK